MSGPDPRWGDLGSRPADGERWDRLRRVLDRHRRLGLIGGEPASHLAHALGMLELAGDLDPGGPALDIGSGGGLPGLVAACVDPGRSWVLVDRSQRAVDALHRAVTELGLTATVTVIGADAADLGRDPGHRHRYGLVTARAVGAPALVAELAAGLLRPGGRLVVADPPGSRGERWPVEALAGIGCRLVARRAASRVHISVIERVGPVGDGVPRSWSRMRRRPLW